jgi:hypothetical protein
MKNPIEYKKLEIPWKSLNEEDWIRYISKSYIKTKKPSGLTTWSNFETKKSVPAKTELDFSFPLTGAYNFIDGVMIYCRKYARQYKRGICEENSSFMNPFNQYPLAGHFDIGKIVNGPGVGFEITSKNLKLLFSSKYISLSDAFTSIMERKKLARAVTPELFLTIGASTKYPILWFGKDPVGYVLDIAKIGLVNEIYRQEIVDSLRNVNLEIKEMAE